MDPNAPILDYASPRKRTKLRLQARSSLTFRFHSQDILVEERLEGKSDAIGGIVMAIVVFIAIGISLCTPGAFRKANIVMTYVLIILGLIELWLLVLVIHQTWRKTRLTVYYQQIILSFSSPVHRRKLIWTAKDITNVLCVDTGSSDGYGMLAELVIIRTAGGDVHLFTDHFQDEIKRLSDEIPRVLHGDEKKPLPVE